MYARSLAAALASLAWPAGDSVLLLEARRREQPLLPALPAGFASRRLATPSHHRLEQWLLPLELLASPIDLLHSTDFIPPFIRRCRSVITVHDLAFLRWPQLLTADSRRYFNQQIAHAVGSSDRIIAVSRATRQDLIELLAADPAKIDVVYEAADPSMGPEPDSAITDLGLKRLGLGGEFLLFVGTLEPRKNVPLLVSAFRALVDAGYEGQLVLAGARGWLYEDVFRAVEALHLGTRVRFVERFSQAELRHLYNGARLLVLPSVYEGFGLPVLEAMACGLPVITSDVSSLPEVAGAAALTVPAADVDALVTAMSRVLNDGALAEELRRRGLARAAEFSWERAAHETVAVYRRAA